MELEKSIRAGYAFEFTSWIQWGCKMGWTNQAL